MREKKVKEKKIKEKKEKTAPDRRSIGLTVKFIALFLAVLLPLIPIAMLLVKLPSTYHESFLGELTYKFNRLKDTDQKKIVIVGGSSVAFGINSELLAEYTGYEVVNFGLYASLGTKIMLDLSKVNINEGDIVIIAPELDSQTLSMYFNAETTWQALDCDLSMLAYIDSENYGALWGQLPEYLSTVMDLFVKGEKISPTGVYRQDSFNEYGDIVYPREYNTMTGGYDPTQTISLTADIFDEEFLAYLNEYIAWVEKQGATAYYTFCPVNEAALHADTTEESIRDFYRYVAENINCAVISDPASSILEQNYFYDSNFHLNDAGVTVRTAALIEDLYRAMGKTDLLSIKLPAAPEPPKKEGPEYWEENEWSNLFIYEDFADGYKIVGVTDEAKAMESLEIPMKANGKAVWSLTKDALVGCEALKELTIRENITAIESGFFTAAPNLVRVNMYRTEAENLTVDQSNLFNGANTALKIYFDSTEGYNNFVTGYFWANYGGMMVRPEE